MLKKHPPPTITLQKTALIFDSSSQKAHHVIYILFRGWAAQLSSLHSPFDKQIIRNDCKVNFSSIAGVNTH